MSSDGFENSPQSVRSAADRLLLLLKTRGPQTVADLGEALSITGEGARQQLIKLAADGLIEATTEVHGVGRPLQVWHLTTAGHARFPDAHAELTVQLLRTIRTELGEAALERLIVTREAETRANYTAVLEGAADLEERIARLAAARRREGYMAEWQAEGDGYLLIENHCPICAAATACQSLCRAELELFREVLGTEATVTRIEHILADARRCVYRIAPAAPSARSAKRAKPMIRSSTR